MELSDPCSVPPCLSGSKIECGPSLSKHTPRSSAFLRFNSVVICIDFILFYNKERFYVFSAGFDDVTQGFKLTRESAFSGVFFISNEFVMMNV